MFVRPRFTRRTLLIAPLAGGLGFAAYRGVRWWDRRPRADAPKAVLPTDEPVRAVAFSPDGRQLAAAAGTEVAVWDRAAGRVVCTLAGHTDRVVGVAYSPDGGRVVGVGANCRLIVWDAAFPDWRLTLHPGEADNPADTRGTRIPAAPRYASSVAFSPDGRAVATGHMYAISPQRAPFGEVRVWDPAGAKPPRVLRKGPGGVHAVAFLPGGGLLVRGETDLRVWDPDTGDARRDVPPRPDVQAVAVAADTGVVAYGGNWSDEADVVAVWNPAADTAQQLPGGPPAGRTTFVAGVAVAADGRAVAVLDRPRDAHGHRIRVWEAATGRPAAEVWCPVMVNALAFSPDGGELAAGCEDGGRGEVRTWDVPALPQAGK